MKSFLVSGILLLAIGAANVRGALLLPFLNPVRSAIVTNLNAFTNSADLTRQQQRQARFLRQARNAIDRSGRASLLNDVQVLANVSSLARRAFPEGELDLLLLEALEQYQAALIDSALNLATNVSQLPPTASTTAAANTIAETIALLDQIDTASGISVATRSLVTAALRLRSAEAALLRPGRIGNRPAQFTARVDGQPFRATPGNGLSSTYNPGSEFVTITARQVSGIPATIRTITLSINDVTPGTTTHTLGSPGTGSHATYSAVGPTNSATFTSLSGHAVVRVDTRAGTSSGTFSFEGADPVQPGVIVRVAGGNFSVPLP